MQPTVGTLVNPRVRLVRPLEEGGMGTVWVAEHLTLEHEVAVKFIAADLLTEGDQARQRFQREAKAAAQIRSPHVVQILDQGLMEDGTPYIVMELMAGNNLGDWLDLTGRLGIAEAASMVTQVARALSKAHQLGIVHRDIKPQNIFLVDEERTGEVIEQLVKVLDFGIARRGKISGGLTKPGVVIGTPEFICPDQVLDSKQPDAQTDLWSLSVVAYQALTGELPFFADTIAKLVGQLIRCEFKPPTELRPGLPKAIDAFFVRAFQREPAERFGSAAKLAVAFREALEPGQGAAKRSPGGEADDALCDEHSSEVFVGESPSTEIHLDELLRQEQFADGHGLDRASVELLSLDEPGTDTSLTASSEQQPSAPRGSPMASPVRLPPIERLPAAAPLAGPESHADPHPTPRDEPAQPPRGEPVEVAPPPSRRRLIIAVVATGGVLAGIAGVLLLRTTKELVDGPPPAPSSRRWNEPASERVMVLAGELTMGCEPDGGAHCAQDEQPQHTVQLDGFQIDRTEVAVAQYRQCVDEDACSAKLLTGSGKEGKDFDRLKCNWNEAGRGSHPINCVSWSQAMDYCRWAGGTLPTEAQWERAARGDEPDVVGWAGRASCTDAVMKSDEGPGCGRGLTWQVGSRPAAASPFGVLDMAGNVREWVHDWYQVQQYEDPTTKNPKGPAVGTERVVRGGGWLDESDGLRPTTRGHLPPDSRAIDLGFRCARGR
jgi:formylglycine-generating enzyme required for sulfatase activity/serine/threonine protein kinase